MSPTGNGDLNRCLSLDLEVTLKDSRIRAFAGVRPDTGRAFTFADNHVRLGGALTQLDDLASSAEFLLGHNIIGFDLPHLRAVNPNLRLLRLPVVDTLRLNPLAFPRNPYHHLVKHYQDGQLKRGRINDPELDARLTLDLFRDQIGEFEGTPPGLLTAWHWSTTQSDGKGFDKVFTHVRQAPRPSDAEALAQIEDRLSQIACKTATQEILQDAEQHGWPLAYALAWLSVSGGNSVMPPWVRYQFPEAGQLVRKLRDRACTDEACEWCRDRHDSRRELDRWFRFKDFRPQPQDDSGKPMQQSIVESAMAGEHVLGILPTGTGKSVCYQVPALSRYEKTGALTVVISPLVALMADQVAGLEAHGISSCVTINGLLSMPERSDALDRVRLGDAAILLIAPEQLRSYSVHRALQQREIGAWVLDEAHCLSRWGHDFRPDYRYVGRYISERAGQEPVPPVLCLTATAKPDVITEIVDYFQREIAIELRVFNGGARRGNLDFVVVQTNRAEKFEHIYQTLEIDLPPDEPGGAIVYCATRRNAEEIATFLRNKGVKAGHFHAGLPPETKKDVQESFVEGELQVIVATNAFGMGINKPDVRLVIHADVPGSLENYLQEAGRAGRDQQVARCVLLYAPEDVERQFSMSARSRLSRREIHGVLKALRNMDRRKRLNGEVVATSGEILMEDDDHSFQRDSQTDDTRTRTAVAWLENAALLIREQNRVQVFPSSLRVGSVEEAQQRIQRSGITELRKDQLLRVTEALFEADPDDGISTDELMSVGGLSSEGVRAALHDLEEMGIASNDTALTAFVHSGVQRASRERFTQATALEEALIGRLRELAPDDMQKGDSYPLQLRGANQLLRDQGYTYALPERLQRLVHSIAADGRGEEGGGGSFGIRQNDRETMYLTLQREWPTIAKTAELRRAAAERLLHHLLGQIPNDIRGMDLLVETTLGKLQGAVKADMVLMSEIKNPVALMDRALLWLHELEIIRLNKGLTVFRPAMTIQLSAERRNFVQTDFEPLRIHCDQQTLQIHVMAEYVQRGLAVMAEALQLAMDYFGMPRQAFLGRWLRDRDKELSRQTTPESWQSIVESLNSPIQREIVANNRENTNVLVLAGPGSGKTRVLVHRIAYLIRVRRENPRSILALAYNRHASVEIKRRLNDLIGDDARGVLVMTCHALAMRLVGASLIGLTNNVGEMDFDAILKDATDLLRGKGLAPDEADDYRARLLSGFRWILVDEYQDIERGQYDLISAVAGRTLNEADDKISLFAVGDDDQNIYAFTGASVEFIRRFEHDYGAKPAYMTDNYRSTNHIIGAANSVIDPARERMKAGHPIQINRGRAKDPPGGELAKRDPVAHGRVQILPVGDRPITQAQAVIAELKRLAELAPDWDWSRCAVIAREWRLLDPIRSLCDLEGIPVQLANEEFSGTWRLREIQALVNWLRQRDGYVIRTSEMTDWVKARQPNTWTELLQEAITEYELETGGAETPVNHATEWLAEWARDVRRRQRGLLLVTAHRAKGLEFDHVVVLDGEWDRVGHGEDRDAPRRLFYVAMTRGRKTLTLASLSDSRNPYLNALHSSQDVLLRKGPVELPAVPPELQRQYKRLSLRDVFLSYGGYRQAEDLVHRAIAALKPGDRLDVRIASGRWQLVDRNDTVVGQLANEFEPPNGMRCIQATVMAIIKWGKEDSEPEYLDRLRSDQWEVVVPELTFEPDERTGTEDLSLRREDVYEDKV